MNNILKDFGPQIDLMNTMSGGTVATAVDIKKLEDRLEIHIKAPSVKSDSFNIFLRGNHLTIYTILNDMTMELGEEEKSSRHLMPLFNRTFDLPASVDRDQIEAVYDDGHLIVVLPFGEGSMEPVKRIDIREY